MGLKRVPFSKRAIFLYGVAENEERSFPNPVRVFISKSRLCTGAGVAERGLDQPNQTKLAVFLHMVMKNLFSRLFCFGRIINKFIHQLARLLLSFNIA